MAARTWEKFSFTKTSETSDWEWSFVDTSISSKDATSSTVEFSKVPKYQVEWWNLSAWQTSNQNCIVISDPRKIYFLKAICMVLSVTLSHAMTSIFIAPNKDIVGSDFLLWIASIIFWTTLFLYYAFKEQMAPWSIGCKTEVVYGGTKKRSIVFNPPISGWAAQLSEWEQLSDFRFQIDCQALQPSFRKVLNISSFSSGLGSDKVIFWHLWSICFYQLL